MNRGKYFSLCMAQSVSWLRACADQPSSHMTRGQVALVRLAIRHKTRQTVPFVDVGTITEYGLTQKLSAVVRCF